MQGIAVDTNGGLGLRIVAVGEIILAKITKDDHKRMSMEHVLFAKQELERRKKAPVHVKSEEIWVEGREPYRTTFIVDPRIGWNNHAIRFWIRSLPPRSEERRVGKECRL